MATQFDAEEQMYRLQQKRTEARSMLIGISLAVGCILGFSYIISHHYIVTNIRQESCLSLCKDGVESFESGSCHCRPAPTPAKEPMPMKWTCVPEVQK